MSEQKEPKFWVVYVIGRSSPVYKHFTLLDATKEAERLAVKERTTVYVLETVHYCYVASLPIVWQSFNGGKT